ncbi:phospholipase-like protein [Tanacetum coccineum]
MKEDACNIPFWVKFHDIPIIAFTNNDSWGRSSYARAMFELRDYVNLKDTFVVALPKVVGEGYIMSIIHVEKLVLVNDDGKPLKPIMEKEVLLPLAVYFSRKKRLQIEDPSLRTIAVAPKLLRSGKEHQQVKGLEEQVKDIVNMLKTLKPPPSPPLRRIQALEQETRELDVESKQIKDLNASYGVTTPQELHRIMKTKKDIGNMTIAEYMEYEARMKRHNVCPTRCEDADFNCFRSKSVAMEYPYYSDNSKIDLYYVLPPLLPCFQPTQTHTNYGHEYTYKDFREDMGSVDECESDMEEQELEGQTDRTVNEWARIQKACLKNWETQIDLLNEKCHAEVTKEVPKSSIDECMAIFANKGTQVARTNEIQGVSFIADDDVLEGDILSKFLPCQLPPKELNLGSFTLPCIIGSLILYAMVYLRASINDMPKSMSEHLKLANLKETDMLVKMADMKQKALLGIVENILVKINKFLIPFNFVIINMLGEPSETMIMGRPFLATIHAQIDVFDREISLGIREDRVLFNMNGGMYHSKIPVKKVYMANSIQEEESFNLLEIGDVLFSYESPACLIFEQCTRFCDDESINTIDSSDNIQEPEVEHKNIMNLEKITSRWHVCKPVRVFYDNECDKDCGMWPTCNPDLSFCSRYNAIYGKGEHGMLE